MASMGLPVITIQATAAIIEPIISPPPINASKIPSCAGKLIFLEFLSITIISNFKCVNLQPNKLVQSSKFKVQSSKFKVQSSKFKVQSSKFKVQSSKFNPST